MTPDDPYHKRNSLHVYLAILAVCMLILFPFLGSVHLFDSDEVSYAESSREMILTGDYLNVQIDFEPFPEKPPLFFWLQSSSMRLFGINEFAARFPNVICGILSLSLLYFLGKQLYGRRFGIFWVLAYGSAILPLFYFKTGIVDPWFNLLVFMGMSWFVFYLDPDREKGKLKNLLLSALFLGLAVLTKGPLALVIFVASFLVLVSLRRFRIHTSFRDVALFTLTILVVGGSWYIYQIAIGNAEVLLDFLKYNLKILLDVKTGHEGFFGYHLVVLLLGVFPASVLALKSITKKAEERELQRIYKQWMYIMIIVVLVVFAVARTKLLHYSSLAYFPLTFLAAWVWEKWADRKIEIGNWQVILMFLIILAYAAAAIMFPLASDQREWLMEKDFFFMDTFTAGALRRNVHWSGFEWLVGPFLLAGGIYSLIQILWRNTRGMLVLHLVVLLYVTASLYLFAPRIEGYTQRVAIKFYMEMKGQDVYVTPLGYKSYSHLFYTDKQAGQPTLSLQHLLEGELDKDAYFVIRLDEKDRYLEKYPQLELVQEKDGYAFAVRKAE